MQIQQNNLCYLYGNPNGDLECKADALAIKGVAHSQFRQLLIIDSSVFATPFFAHPAKHSVIVRPASEQLLRLITILPFGNG
jgi:hypothetical protein